MISIHGLSKQYNPPSGPQALAGIDLEISQGEIFGRLGPNGAGRGTWVRDTGPETLMVLLLPVLTEWALY